MDEVRPNPVKTRKPSAGQPRLPALSRAKFVEPLTPLHRLARFKEIRDRNLARNRNLRKSIQGKRNSLAPNYIMDTVVNGTSRSETINTKVKSLDSLSNGNDAPPHTNGVKPSTNGDGLNANVPAPEQVEVKENIDNSPQANGNSEVKDEVVVSVDCNEPVQVSIPSEPVETGNEKEAENESESDGGEGHESEGSSLDVVGESSSESLDLQVSRRDSEEVSENDQIVLQSSESASTVEPAQEDQPKVVTPELVRRIRAGGRIAARRNLRGEISTPAVKRKLDDDEVTSSHGKKVRDDGTISSPGWQFFSPTKSLPKFWTPFRSTPGTSESRQETNESMVVNVDDQSNIFDKINEETAISLIEESQEKPSQRWCAIM